MSRLVVVIPLFFGVICQFFGLMMKKNSQVQYLRAFAALLVVAFHAPECLSPSNTNFSFLVFGRYGVDVFFVISGFIMGSMDSNVGRIDFFVKRLIRIMPLYWLVTLTVVLARHSSSNNIYNTFSLVSSFLLLPHYSVEHPGHIWPVYVPGWTLSYEIFFYLIFSLFVSGKNIFRVVGVSCVFIILILFGYFLNPSDAVLKVCTNPVLFEFIIGMWIAIWFKNANIFNVSAILLPFVVGFLLYLVAFFFELDLAFTRSILAGCVLIFFLLFLRPIQWSWLELVGDASYSIYLMQMLVLVATRFLWRELGLSTMSHVSIWTYVLFSLIVSVVAGVFVFEFFEKPVGAYFRKYFSRRVAHSMPR